MRMRSNTSTTAPNESAPRNLRDAQCTRNAQKPRANVRLDASVTNARSPNTNDENAHDTPRMHDDAKNEHAYFEKNVHDARSYGDASTPPRPPPRLRLTPPGLRLTPRLTPSRPQRT